MGERYGKLPTEILNLSIKDFSINTHVYMKFKEQEHHELKKAERQRKNHRRR